MINVIKMINLVLSKYWLDPQLKKWQNIQNDNTTYKNSKFLWKVFFGQYVKKYIIAKKLGTYHCPNELEDCVKPVACTLKKKRFFLNTDSLFWTARLNKSREDLSLPKLQSILWFEAVIKCNKVKVNIKMQWQKN